MSFDEQIMSKDKYPSIFSRQMDVTVFIILQIFFLSRDGFRPVARAKIFDGLKHQISYYLVHTLL